MSAAMWCTRVWFRIYKDKMLGAHLFETSVLYSTQPIPREDVPQGWFCYDLRGTARHPDEPHALVDRVEDNHVGSILSYLPLKNGRSQYRLVKNRFQMTGTNSNLAEFCVAESICCPETPLRHLLCPASPEEARLFYALSPEKNAMGPPLEPSAAGPVGRGGRNRTGGVSSDEGAIGHVRIDFGYKGKEFWHYLMAQRPEELNT